MVAKASVPMVGGGVAAPPPLPSPAANTRGTKPRGTKRERERGGDAQGQPRRGYLSLVLRHRGLVAVRFRAEKTRGGATEVRWLLMGGRLQMCVWAGRPWGVVASVVVGVFWGLFIITGDSARGASRFGHRAAACYYVVMDFT